MPAESRNTMAEPSDRPSPSTAHRYPVATGQAQRASAVQLTDRTWHALARVYRPLGEQIQQVDGHLTDRERRTLVEGLAHLTATFDGTRTLVADRPDAGPGD